MLEVDSHLKSLKSGSVFETEKDTVRFVVVRENWRKSFGVLEVEGVSRLDFRFEVSLVLQAGRLPAGRNHQFVCKILLAIVKSD